MSAIRTCDIDRKISWIPTEVALKLFAITATFAWVMVTCNDASAENRVRTVSATTIPSVSLTHKPMSRLEPGIVIGQERSAGYSDLVTLVLPRLSAGHVDSLPSFATQYASMFKFAVLANVTQRKEGDSTAYLLDKVGIGFAMDINGKMVVVTRDTANQFGANLGMIDRGVLGGNEDCLEDVIQIARTARMVVFDAKANMLVGDTHEHRIIRHFIWASPASGKIGFLVWLLKENGSEQHEIVSPTMQLLPSGFHEDRQIHVSEGGFLSSIPTPDRFALVSIPQGTPVTLTPRMKAVAGKKNMTKADLEHLVAGVSESLAQLQVQPASTKR